MSSIILIIVPFLVSLIHVSYATYPVIKFTLLEEEKSGHPVGNISQKSREHLNTNSTDLRYYFAPPAHYVTTFSINDRTGILYTSVVIDRETICLHQLVCTLSFNVGIRTADSLFVQIFTIDVLIEDKNDNPPMFQNKLMTIHISEASQVGYMSGEVKAVDDDSGSNSIQSYQLVEEDPETNGTFSLHVKKKLDGRFSPRIRLEKILDRESKDEYEVTVIAADGGSPVLSGTVRVTIKVDDFNDNPPEFSQSLYNVTVNETMTATETVLTLTASDQDAGNNAVIFYKLSEYQTNKEVINLFTVDRTSGEIRAKVALTSKAGETYNFYVEAEDNGQESLLAQAEVIVNVVDAGNNEPTVTVGLMGPGNVGFVNISENATVGTLVAHVNVEDPDTGSNGEISCEISNLHFGIETLGEKAFKVVVRSVLDREVVSAHNLTVTCSDKGVPSLSGSTHFMVRITDINDNRPRFESEIYTAKIQENYKGNKIIVQVSATDDDIGNNGAVHYASHADGLHRFVVDPNNGIIMVNTTFNREKDLTVTFRVLAIDKGNPPLTGTATVILAVDDVNDNAPQFNKSVHGFRFFENQATGTNVAMLDAFDVDAGANAEFDFSMAQEYVGKVPFILLSNGLLKANKQLDREEKSRYDFVAIVTDRGEKRLSSSSHVTVIVDDMNDNSPILTFPNPANNSVSVAYPDYDQEFVAKIEAYDLDDGINKELFFTIKSGNDLGIFLLDSSSGVLMFDARMDIGGDKTVELEISVQDKGYPMHETVKKLFVELKYTNATFLESPADDGSSKYVVISVIVVVVTLIISGAIIASILLLRTLDRKKKKAAIESDSNGTDSSDFGFMGTQSHTIFSADTLSSGSGEGRDLIKKKEVSFSLDTTDSTEFHQQLPTSSVRNSSQDKSTKFSTGYSHTRGESPHTAKSYTPTLSGESPRNGLDTRDIQKEANVQLHSIKLQQVLLQNRAKQWVHAQQQQFGVAPHEDHHSDGSAETIGSDSGRGCSEEEDVFSTPSADDTKTFDTTSHDCLPPPPPSSHSYPSPPPLSNSYLDQRRPPAYTTKQPWARKPHLSHRDVRNCHSYINNDKNVHRQPTVFTTDDVLHNYRDDLEHFPSRASWRSSGHGYQGGISPLDYTGDSSMQSFFEKTPVGFGRDDDDNCSTTTSGSYTVNSEEIL